MSERWVEVEDFTKRLMYSLMTMGVDDEATLKGVQKVIDTAPTKEIDGVPCVTPSERDEWQNRIDQAFGERDNAKEERDYYKRQYEQCFGRVNDLESKINAFADGIRAFVTFANELRRWTDDCE